MPAPQVPRAWMPTRLGARLGEPGGHAALLERGAGELEAALVDVLLGGQRLEEPVAQHLELQAVEEVVHLLAVPGPDRQVGGREVQLEVAHQRVEAAVADHVAEVGPQRLALLAGDLVGVGDHVVEAVVLVDPLGGVARPDAGDAGQVVGGLPHQRGELGVARRRHAVLGLDGLGRHPGQVGDPAHGVEHGGPLAHELERVAVTGQDQHVHVVGDRAGDQGRDDVVGLEAVLLEVRDVEGVEHLLDQRQLALELRRRGGAVGLVVGVLLQPERLPRHVEGDREVGRLLVAQHVDQHRGEAEDRVGVLPGRGREVLHRKREERAIRQGVAVEQQQAGPRRGRSGAVSGTSRTLSRGSDSTHRSARMAP